MPDGRDGWVFNGGIHLKQKVVYIKKWVEVPDTRPELMRNFKYANFKGKVMRYAIARDLYEDIINAEIKDVAQLEAYLNQVEKGPYTDILRRVYELSKKGDKQNPPVKIDSSFLLRIAEGLESKDKQIMASLDNLTAGVTKKLNQKKIAEKSHFENEEFKSEEVVFASPDFSNFSRVTTIDGTTSFKTLNKAEILINTNPLIREETVFPFSKRSNATFHLDVSLSLIHI